MLALGTALIGCIGLVSLALEPAAGR